MGSMSACWRTLHNLVGFRHDFDTGLRERHAGQLRKQRVQTAVKPTERSVPASMPISRRRARKIGTEGRDMV